MKPIEYEAFKWKVDCNIKDTVEGWIKNNAENLRGKKVADAPAGNGVTSRMLQEAGAEVLAFDLFPENFQVPGIRCEFADFSEGLPVPDGSLDLIVCQEGIEHISDQPKLFREFARSLKSGGRLLLTCPNASNLRGRMSFLLGESEYFGKMLPPNEVDSIWFSKDQKIYFGHVFLIGISRIRLFSHLAGFRLTKMHSTRVNRSALLFFPLLAPLIKLFTRRALSRFLRKNPEISPAAADSLRELAKLSSSSKVLLETHLCLEFEKETTAEKARYSARHLESGFTT